MTDQTDARWAVFYADTAGKSQSAQAAALAVLRGEQKGIPSPFRSLQAAFIRTRPRKLQPPRYAWKPTAAVSFAVVRNERIGGKVAQRFLVGLGTLKLGGTDGGNREWFLTGAVGRLVWAGFSPELERKLLLALVRKVEITADDIAQTRKRIDAMSAGIGGPVRHAELDKLAAVLTELTGEE